MDWAVSDFCNGSKLGRKCVSKGNVLSLGT